MEKAKKLIDDGGLGHTSSLYINTLTEQEKQQKCTTESVKQFLKGVVYLKAQNKYKLSV